MAFSAAASSGYAPGSIAARPTRRVGGVRRQDESPDQFRDRMDAGYRSNAMSGSPNPTRANNIAQARADGTFDAKRNAFNAANKSSFMDASGNIGPKAEIPTTPTPSPAPAPAPSPTTTASAPMRPRGPATFDGKSKADFFGAGMAKYGPSADMPGIYNDSQVKGVAANGGKPLPTPSPAAPASAKPSGMVAAASSSPAKPYAGPMARPAGSMTAKPPAGSNDREVGKMSASRPTPQLGKMSAHRAGVYPGAEVRTEAASKQMPGAPPPGTVYQDWRPGPKAPATQVSSVPTANHASPKPSQPSIDELRQKAEAAKAARQPGLTKVAKSFVGAAKAVDKAVPAAVSSVTSGIKNTGDSIVSAIDRGMAPARRWLYGSNQETPEEKAYKDAMAKQPQAQPDKQQPEPPKKKSPTFRKPYLANRPASLN